MPSGITAASVDAEQATIASRAKNGPAIRPARVFVKVLRSFGGPRATALAGAKCELDADLADQLAKVGSVRILTQAEFEADNGQVDH
jgi:hypothetical protein